MATGPESTGLLYVKREKIGKVSPLFASGTTRPKDDIQKFELYGTWPETILGIKNAIELHQALGSQRKEQRHRHLTDYWTSAVSRITTGSPGPLIFRLHPVLPTPIRFFVSTRPSLPLPGSR